MSNAPLYQCVRWRYGGRAWRHARKAWGAGPWRDEPDAARFWCCGYACHAFRTDELGSWCGYVDVPPGHPWHGLPKDDLPVYVHRGVTYAEPIGEVWRVGFDCAHYGDMMPGARALLYKRVPRAARLMLAGSYKPLGYVMHQCWLLALQAHTARARALIDQLAATAATERDPCKTPLAQSDSIT